MESDCAHGDPGSGGGDRDVWFRAKEGAAVCLDGVEHGALVSVEDLAVSVSETVFVDVEKAGHRDLLDVIWVLRGCVARVGLKLGLLIVLGWVRGGCEVDEWAVGGCGVAIGWIRLGLRLRMVHLVVFFGVENFRRMGMKLDFLRFCPNE